MSRSARLVLDACQIGDEPDPDFDAIVDEAARAFPVPIAVVSIVDGDRQGFKARVGLEATSTPRSISFCGHAMHGDEVFAVLDAAADPRFAGYPLVIGGPKIRFYAGAPLVLRDGHKIGTFCIIDSKPREALSDEEGARRRAFAARTVELIQGRQA